jgi:hypothetical protein
MNGIPSENSPTANVALQPDRTRFARPQKSGSARRLQERGNARRTGSLDPKTVMSAFSMSRNPMGAV